MVQSEYGWAKLMSEIQSRRNTKDKFSQKNGLKLVRMKIEAGLSVRAEFSFIIFYSQGGLVMGDIIA